MYAWHVEAHAEPRPVAVDVRGIKLALEVSQSMQTITALSTWTQAFTPFGKIPPDPPLLKGGTGVQKFRPGT
jgi:hypothetical protein